MVENHYFLFIKSSCPFCQMAIDLLMDKGLTFVYTDLEYAPNILEETKKSVGHQTVPMISRVVSNDFSFPPVQSYFIGGYDDLKKHLGVEDEE